MTPIITREQWDAKAAAAHKTMTERAHLRKVLLVIAAQHPLEDGRRPGPEFRARLDRARALALAYRDQGYAVEAYVPGSRHQHAGRADQISLATAGTEYLRAHDWPADLPLHGADLNRRYKADAGVYNTADECYVAAQYFHDGQFGRLVTVTSEVQVLRQKLHYLWFGVEALAHTAPLLESFHNPVTEAYFQIPYVRDVDPDWQAPNSELGQKSRTERRPTGDID